MLKNILGSLSQEDFVVVGGDFNCTLDFVVDRNGEEPQSVICESFESNNHSGLDVWREKNKNDTI